MSNPAKLLDYGQSYWLDNLTREKITGGELQKRVNEQGLRGITSNPAIFNKSISGSVDYDEQIYALVKKGKSAQQIYEALTVKDVQDACDMLIGVYTESGGTDGFVSLEVAPNLARDTEGTINQARKLFKLVGKPNCMIKIPGTKEGLPAIEQMLFEGVPINITLLFSVNRYEEVANCYINALKRRLAKNLPVKIESVASFFLSRIDTLIDSLLGNHIISNNTKADFHPEALMGKAGIVSARLAYKSFKKIFACAEWKNLQNSGAKVQRPLWASTSTKNSLYSDVRYVEALIGKDTVNTLPDETIAAFADHGKLIENTIENDMDEAEKLFAQLKTFDIDIEAVTHQLEDEGIAKFMEPYNKLISNISAKRVKMLGNTISTQTIKPGILKTEIASAYTALDEKQVDRRLFNKDPYLWKSDAENIKSINNRLGWLELPTNAGELIEFANQIKAEGYKHAVLLGMGGSSLCSEVARTTFTPADGYPELLVLDNTAPAAILDMREKIDITKTLFIVASKSGGTLETISFFRYFYEQLNNIGFADAGKNFVAITDDATSLVKIAEEHKFRKIFINRGDIGGRYSVLSDFGLLPMALMGIDIQAVLESTAQMIASCDAELPAADNPGVSLGAALGIAQLQGRDKVTFVMSDSIKAFGYWVEQLIAESTGKENKGLIPVTGEALGAPEVYGNDRIFVHMYLASDSTRSDETKLAELEKAGMPVISIRVADKNALGGEYYRFEIATAIAGMVMGINSFNEPNVAESKKNSSDLLEEWSKKGSFAKPEILLQEQSLIIYGSDKLKQATHEEQMPAVDLMDDFLSLIVPGNYISLLCYFKETDRRNKILQQWRMQLRDKMKTATTLAYGPRYLHSTGQLHKGGPASGAYIILTWNKQKLAIPGQKFGFEILNQAQSLGDFRSLNNKGRKVIYIDLGKNIDKTLKNLLRSLDQNLLAKEE